MTARRLKYLTSIIAGQSPASEDVLPTGSLPFLQGSADFGSVTLHIGPWRVHSTNLITGALFIGLGLLFIWSGGTVAFERFYIRTGLFTLSMNWQQTLTRVTAGIPDWTWLALIVIAGLWWGRRLKA